MNTGNASAKMRLKNTLAKFTNVIKKGKNKGSGNSQASTLYSHSVPKDLQFMVSEVTKAMYERYGSDCIQQHIVFFLSPSSHIINISVVSFFATRHPLEEYLLVPKADLKRTSRRVVKRIDIRPRKIFSTR